MKSTVQERLEEGFEALREIVMLCGHSDPSDGEGMSPQEAVEIVRARLGARVCKNRVAKSLRALLIAGQKCSNVCHNLKQRQSSSVSDDNRRSMDDSQRDWDAAVRALPKWMFKR